MWDIVKSTIFKNLLPFCSENLDFEDLKGPESTQNGSRIGLGMRLGKRGRPMSTQGCPEGLQRGPERPKRGIFQEKDC